MNPQDAKPSDAAVVERAFSFANEAMFTVALQRRRMRSTEPEDKEFAIRWVADFQFLIVALRRLRRAAELARKVSFVADGISIALKHYDEALPQLLKMRNVGEHIDDYALDNSKRRHKDVSRKMLQVAEWDGTTYKWLDEALNVDDAHAAALRLYSAVRTAKRSFPKVAEPNEDSAPS